MPAAHKTGEPCLHAIYHAAAYRTPDDPRPGQRDGVGAVPWPDSVHEGLGAYERGDVGVGCGRSCALGFVAKKIASAEEVRNRQTTSRVGTGKGFASEAQQKEITRQVKAKNVTLEQLTVMLTEIGATSRSRPGGSAGCPAVVTGPRRRCSRGSRNGRSLRSSIRPMSPPTTKGSSIRTMTARAPRWRSSGDDPRADSPRTSALAAPVA